MNLSFLLRIRFLRRSWHVVERTIPFVIALFSKDGLISRDGRTLVKGKARRIFLSTFPPLARAMQKKYGMQGGCISCGASCKMLFRCPHWDDTTHLCTVYEDRPNICRLFPITPGDIIDRTISAKGGKECGFTFTKK